MDREIIENTCGPARPQARGRRRVTVKVAAEWSELAWGSVIALAVFAAIGAATWAYFAEPWYSRQLLERMQGGAYQAPWRDETARVSDLFPDGMSRDAVAAFLKHNGFSCPWAANDN